MSTYFYQQTVELKMNLYNAATRLAPIDWVTPLSCIVYKLTLCAVFQQSFSHFKPQRAALSWKLPSDLQALCRASSVKYDRVNHRQVVSKQMPQ